MPDSRSLYDPQVSDTLSRPASSGSRAMPRDVVELRTLADRQPELAPAANLQVDLIESVRRVQ
jgi:hypothetical protein